MILAGQRLLFVHPPSQASMSTTVRLGSSIGIGSKSQKESINTERGWCTLPSPFRTFPCTVLGLEHICPIFPNTITR